MGSILWPGFGENSRVLKWIFERVSGAGRADETAIGHVPSKDALDIAGLNLSPDSLRQLFAIDREAWLKEIEGLRNYFIKFGDRLPQGIKQELGDLEKRVSRIK